jgi:hypothetical protein
LSQSITFTSIKGEGFDADTGRHSAEHLGPFQVDHCQAAGIVVGGQQDSAVRAKAMFIGPLPSCRSFCVSSLSSKIVPSGAS